MADLRFKIRDSLARSDVQPHIRANRRRRGAVPLRGAPKTLVRLDPRLWPDLNHEQLRFLETTRFLRIDWFDGTKVEYGNAGTRSWIPRGAIPNDRHSRKYTV